MQIKTPENIDGQYTPKSQSGSRRRLYSMELDVILLIRHPHACKYSEAIHWLATQSQNKSSMKDQMIVPAIAVTRRNAMNLIINQKGLTVFVCMYLCDVTCHGYKRSGN